MQWMALGNLGFALIVPAIVALYLLKRKVQDVEVPSTLLWQRTLQSWEAVRPWEKLQRNLLLLLQLLAAILLVLALLRPAVPAAGVIAEHAILVIDTSGSMLAREADQDGEKTRFARAVEEARSLVEQLGSGQAVTLIEAGRDPKIWLSRSTDKQAVLGALDSLRPRPGSADQRAALSLAGAIAATEAGSGVMWFGDGGGEELQEQAGLISIPGPFRFYPAGHAKENAAIGAFVTQAGAAGTEGLLRIDNYGTQPQQGRISIYGLDQELLDVDSFSVDGGASQTVTFERLPAASAYRAVIDADADSLAEDDVSWSVPYASGKGRAVLVSPAGNRFLHQALQTVGQMEVETVSEPPAANSGAADLWIFDGIVPEKLPEGNILLIAPHQQTSWFPYQGIADVAGSPEVLQQGDPLMKYVDWRDVHVAKTAVWGAIPGMRPLVRAGETELIAAGTLSGRKAVIIGFDLHDSDLPLRPAFPILMQNAVARLSAGQTVPIGPAQPGDALAIPLTPGATKRTLTLPDGSTHTPEAQGTTWLYPVPEQTGLYRLTEETGPSDPPAVRYFAVHMSESESDIAPRTLRAAIGQTDGSGAGGEGQTGGVDQTGRSPDDNRTGKAPSTTGVQELTYWLAAFALLAVFAEWRVYRRGY